MAMRTVHDPYGNNLKGSAGQYPGYGDNAPLVDKHLGNAFGIVHEVQMNLPHIQYVVYNMQAIVTLAQNLPNQQTTVFGTAGALGSSTLINLPATVTLNKIMGTQCLLVTAINSEIYTESSGVFMARIVDNQLRFTLLSGSPGVCVGGQIRWLLTHTV